MLGAVIGKDPAHFLHPGNEDHVGKEDDHSDQAFQQVDSQNAGNDFVKEGGNGHGQQEKQKNGQSQAHGYRNAHNGLLKGLAAQVFFQPQVKFGGLLLHFLRSQIRGPHQRLDANHLGIEKAEDAPEKGPGCNGSGFVQLPVCYLQGQAVLAPDDHGVLFRAPHENALDQGLTADGGFEFFLICHDCPFRAVLTGKPAG